MQTGDDAATDAIPRGPVSTAARIDVLDVLRGVAVCGILAVNIFVMGTVAGTQGRTFPAQWNADWVVWVLQRLFLEGPMRGLFTMLFGAGMVLMLRAAEGPDGRAFPIDVWARRCLALMAFGVVHFAVFMWPGEILWTYGLAGLALLAFRTASVRTLWIWTLLILTCLSLHRAYDTSTYVATYQHALAGEQALAEGRQPDAEQQAGMEAAAAARAANHPDPETIADEVRQRTEWRSLFGWSASGWAFRHLGVYSWIGVVESLAFMLAGMALYRSGILAGATSSATLWRILLLCGLLGLGLRVFDMAWQARTGFELDIHRMNPWLSILRSGWYQPARLLMTLAWVAAIVLLARGGPRFWTPPFRALGRMSLTTYTLQSILTSLLFYALGYVGAFGAASLMIVTFAICCITAAFSMVWLRRAPMGPAEQLLRAIAYGRRTREPTPTRHMTASNPSL